MQQHICVQEKFTKGKAKLLVNIYSIVSRVVHHNYISYGENVTALLRADWDLQQHPGSDILHPSMVTVI